MMRVWIDIENTPHVLFFRPILDELARRGHTSWVTARDYGQISELLTRSGRSFVRVGGEYGAGRRAKLLGLARRAWQLRQAGAGRSFDVAFNHGSRTHIAAAAMAGVPCVTSYDYEHSSKMLVHELTVLTLVPALVAPVMTRRVLSPRKIVGYPGIKEMLYLREFEPVPDYPRSLGLADGTLLVVLRPPATSAHYHAARSGELVEAAIDRIDREEHEVSCVVIPRDSSQRAAYEARFAGRPRFLVPPGAVDALSLIFAADAVISGGGTMNREAALLGVPVYSIFGGKTGVIDEDLARRGLVTLLRSASDVGRIRFQKRAAGPISRPVYPQLAAWMVDRLEEIGDETRGLRAAADR